MHDPFIDGAARIELLEARAAITELVHVYALNIRSGNAAASAQLFTEDAIFEVRERLGGIGAGRTRSKLTGRAAIMAYLNDGAASQTRLCPLIQNLIIRVSGHQATSTSAMVAFMLATGHSILGEYEDSFSYQHEWRFCSRIFTILGQYPIRAEGAPK
jgi:SnoaL-like domain